MVNHDRAEVPRYRPLILAVDDNPRVLQSYSMALEPEHEVLTATSGRAAIDIVRSRHVDAVLLDVLLPGMDGFQLLTRLKALDPTLVIILVSALSRTAAVVRGIQLGAYDYLTKPFDSFHLALLVSSAVRARPADRGTVLLVGDDVTSVAALAVFLACYVGVATAPARLGGLPDPTQHNPCLVIYNSAGCSSLAIDFIERLHECFPRSRLIVFTTEPAQNLPAPQQNALPRSFSLIESQGLDDLLQRIAMLMPGLEELAALSSRLRPHLLTLVEVVARSYQRSPNAADLARSIGLSVDRLAHVVRDRLGVSLMEYVARFKFEASRHLLTVTDSTLEDIASETGFSSASHLSRVFLRRSGLRPGNYRTQLKSNGMWPPDRGTSCRIHRDSRATRGSTSDRPQDRTLAHQQPDVLPAAAAPILSPHSRDRSWACLTERSGPANVRVDHVDREGPS